MDERTEARPWQAAFSICPDYTSVFGVYVNGIRQVHIYWRRKVCVDATYRASYKAEILVDSVQLCPIQEQGRCDQEQENVSSGQLSGRVLQLAHVAHLSKNHTKPQHESCGEAEMKSSSVVL